MGSSRYLFIYFSVYNDCNPTVCSYFTGHEIVATIAQIHLHPSVLPSLCSILNYTDTDPSAPLCHLAPVATWADRMRYKMRWSAALHYIGAVGDHPSDTCLFPGDRGWAGKSGVNVLGAVRNVTGILEDWVGDLEDDDRANEALKFLVHFVGDMHMPLHLTGRDRGGNGNKVSFDGRVTSKFFLPNAGIENLYTFNLTHQFPYRPPLPLGWPPNRQRPAYSTPELLSPTALSAD